MHKKYQLSTGDFLQYNGKDYVAEVDWYGKPILTIFTPDEGEQIAADNAVAIFENVYAKREKYYVLAWDFLKSTIIEQINYERYIKPFREILEKPEYVFDGLLAEVKLEFIMMGNEDEILFSFYDYSRDQYYRIKCTYGSGICEKYEENE